MADDNSGLNGCACGCNLGCFLVIAAVFAAFAWRAFKWAMAVEL
jgi:hypothetical protein